MASNGKVTAGMPSLSSDLRATISKARLNREMSRQRLLDHVGREVSTVAPDGAIDTTSPDEQMGTPLSSTEMQRRLLLCNANLRFEVALKDASKIGIYVIENREGTLEKRFVCGMLHGVMPERSIRVPVNKEVPDVDGLGAWVQIKRFDHEIRGWRTVLAMLLRSRLITQPQIDRYWPVSSGVSRNWQQFTQ